MTLKEAPELFLNSDFHTLAVVDVNDMLEFLTRDPFIRFLLRLGFIRAVFLMNLLQEVFYLGE